MAKDERLWMRFPISFDEDPTIEILSDAAFRAFVSMNGYSRRNDLDGRIPARLALKKWGADVLTEIADARPESPILALDGDDYLLTKYARHQDTTEARERRAATGSENGRKGGRPRKVAPPETQPVTEQEPNRNQTETKLVSETEPNGNPNETQPKPESESESESELKLETSDSDLTDLSALELNARELSSEEIAGCRKVLEKFGVESRDELAAVTLVELLIEASPRPVTNIVGYIVRCTQRSPQKVRSLAVEAERQAARVRLAVAS